LVFLRPFGIFYRHLVNILAFFYVTPRKIWQPWYHVINKGFCRNSFNAGTKTFVRMIWSDRGALILLFEH
jgi:hypothetical protein